jgi:hypothetical protein
MSKQSIKQAQGVRLKKERIRCGFINQTDFAKNTLKILQQTYSKYESGQSRIPLDIKEKLLSLKFDVDFIENGGRVPEGVVASVEEVYKRDQEIEGRKKEIHRLEAKNENHKKQIQVLTDALACCQKEVAELRAIKRGKRGVLIPG